MTFDVAIKDESVEVISPEGQTAQMPLTQLLDEIRPPIIDSGDVPLPPGTRYVKSRHRVTIWVHETRPQVWNLKWIRAKSRPKHDGASYRDAIIALPYIVTIAVFVPVDDGKLALSATNECFFRNSPLEQYDCDELLVPCLLNCSLFGSPQGKDKIGVDGKPVVWICTQHLDRSQFNRIASQEQRMLKGFHALMNMLLSTGFNYSSEEHEFCSGFTASKDVDRRVSSIEAWKKATKRDPHFADTVPWLRTGYTVKEVVERVFTRQSASRGGVRCAQDVARVVFHHAARVSQQDKSSA